MATLIEETVRIQADIAALSDDFATLHRMLHWMLPRQLQVVDVGTGNTVAVLTLDELSAVNDGTGRWIPRWFSGGDSLSYSPELGTWVLNAAGYSGWRPNDQLLGRYYGMTVDEFGNASESTTHFVVSASNFYESVWSNTQANSQRLTDWLKPGVWVTSNENNSISGFYASNGTQNGYARYVHINPSAQTGASANYPRIFWNGVNKWELQFSATQPASQNLQSSSTYGDYSRVGQTVTANVVSMYAMTALVYGHAKQQEARYSVEQPGALLDQTHTAAATVAADYARRTGDYPTASQNAAEVMAHPAMVVAMSEVTAIDLKIPSDLGATLAATELGVSTLEIRIPDDLGITLTGVQDGVASLALAVPSDLIDILNQIVARLSGATIEVQSPTSASGEIELTRGDTYSRALGNAIEFELGDNIPDLSEASVFLEAYKLSDNTMLLIAEGTVVGNSASPESIYFELPGEDTGLLMQVDQKAYEYKVVLVFPTAQRTIGRGDLRVRR